MLFICPRCIASYPDNGNQIELAGSGIDYSEFLNAVEGMIYHGDTN